MAWARPGPGELAKAGRMTCEMALWSDARIRATLRAMAAGSLRVAAPEGDGRCAECERAQAVGPCAACESMICGDCGVMSRDPEGVKVICLSCARLIAGVRERKPARPGAGARLVAVALLLAFGLGALALLGNCAHGREPTHRSAGGASAGSAPAGSTPDGTAPDPAGSAGAPGPRLPRPPPPPGTAWLHEIVPPAGTGELAGGVVAARVFAFADSQLHYLLGKRTFAQSPFAERMSFEVAVRPAALDDGGDLLLALFLDEHQRAYADHTPVFLGDAADLSCVQEIEAFFAVLADAGLDRLLSVTSNHDGFFAGNFTSRRDLDGQLAITDMPHDWTRACALPGRFDDHRLTKSRAVQRLAARLPAGPAWATHVAAPGEPGPPGRAAARPGDGPSAFRSAFLAYVRPLGGGEPGAPPAWGIFLDTVDYRGFDLEESLGAGTTGAISAEQMRFLDRAVDEVRRLAGAAPLTLVVFGHHPFASLEPASRTRLRRFLAAHVEIAAYVTAHEHAPTERRIALGPGKAPGASPSHRRVVPELVIGSTTDAPQSAGLLAVQIDPRTGQRSVSRRRLVLDAAAACADVPPLPRDALGYTAYRIARDGIPELDVGTLDQILFALGLDDLATARIEQGLGALLVENELVRSWARLHAGAPLARPAEDQRVLDHLLGQRYAAGGNLAAVWPFLRGQAPRAPAQGSWHAWHDPVTAPVLAAAEQGVHRFGAHAPTIARLRSLRTSTPEAHRYFLCHAAHAARAEARTPQRKGHVLYIH